MNLQAQLLTLKGKSVTVYVIGNVEYAGILFDVGDGWIDIDNGVDQGGVALARSLIPFTAIACVLHR